MNADTAEQTGTSTPGRYRNPAERFLSSSFKLTRGQHVDPDGVRGYPIDFSSKAEAPTLLPGYVHHPGWNLWVAHAQRALGTYERYLAGDGEEWLGGARAAADLLLENQASDGGWVQTRPYPHTYVLEPPWVSAMACRWRNAARTSCSWAGQRETSEERYSMSAMA